MWALIISYLLYSKWSMLSLVFYLLLLIVHSFIESIIFNNKQFYEYPLILDLSSSLLLLILIVSFYTIIANNVKEKRLQQSVLLPLRVKDVGKARSYSILLPLFAMIIINLATQIVFINSVTISLGAALIQLGIPLTAIGIYYVANDIKTMIKSTMLKWIVITAFVSITLFLQFYVFYNLQMAQNFLDSYIGIYGYLVLRSVFILCGVGLLLLSSYTFNKRKLFTV